ncbi:hypothetical protein BH20ACI2_BH20ACI2_03870 [soil metagenome]
MVNPAYRNSSVNSDELTSLPASTAKNQSSDTFPSQRANNKNYPQIDEVIGALANAYENKRARQVVEWEKRQIISRAPYRAFL